MGIKSTRTFTRDQILEHIVNLELDYMREQNTIKQKYQHYTDEELEVYLDGNRLYSVFDYNTVSTTQVQFTFDLIVGDYLRFRIDRVA